MLIDHHIWSLVPWGKVSPDEPIVCPVWAFHHSLADTEVSTGAHVTDSELEVKLPVVLLADPTLATKFCVMGDVCVNTSGENEQVDALVQLLSTSPVVVSTILIAFELPVAAFVVAVSVTAFPVYGVLLDTLREMELALCCCGMLAVY